MSPEREDPRNRDASKDRGAKKGKVERRERKRERERERERDELLFKSGTIDSAAHDSVGSFPPILTRMNEIRFRSEANDSRALTIVSREFFFHARFIPVLSAKELRLLFLSFFFSLFLFLVVQSSLTQHLATARELPLNYRVR